MICEIRTIFDENAISSVLKKENVNILETMSFIYLNNV